MSDVNSLKLRLRDALYNRVPDAALDQLIQWIIDYKIIVTITGKRHSLLGDYRHPYNEKGHRISINGSLNKFSFLITFVHEMAHLTCWMSNRNKVLPHGNEWKWEFRNLIIGFMKEEIFSNDIQQALKSYLLNPAASSCTDDDLMRVLKKYDKQKFKLVEELEMNAVFKLHNGKTYRKQERIRKRFRCIEIETKRVFLFSPVAEVLEIEK